MTNQATPRDESTAGPVWGRWSRMSPRARVISVLWVLVVLALAIVLAIVVLIDQAGTTQSNATRTVPPLTTEVVQAEQQDRRSDVASANTVAPEFEPESGELSNCVGSFAERPGCGAEGRGGWRQSLVFLVLLGGLAFIGWRVYAGAKKQQRSRQQTGHRA